MAYGIFVSPGFKYSITAVGIDSDSNLPGPGDRFDIDFSDLLTTTDPIGFSQENGADIAALRVDLNAYAAEVRAGFASLSEQVEVSVARLEQSIAAMHRKTIMAMILSSAATVALTVTFLTLLFWNGGRGFF